MNKQISFLFVSIFYFVASNAHAWTIEKVQGVASVVSQGKKQAAAVGTKLPAGAIIETKADGKVELKDGESLLWLAPNSKFLLRKLTNDDYSEVGILEITKGSLRAKFKRPEGPDTFPYEVRSKSVVASVRGTEFIVSVEGRDEQVCTLEGLVRVSSLKSAAEGWDVSARHGLFVKPNEMPKVRETSAEQEKKWLEVTTLNN
jgi:hypothetical protein